MYGWRARIAIIVSPPNTVAEVEFNRMAPEGVSVHASRMFRPSGVVGLDRQVLEATNESLPQVAGALAPLKADVVVFTHTLGSMVLGAGRDSVLTDMLSEAAGCHAISTAGAVISAFNTLGVQRISLVAPYKAELVEMEKEYLERSIPGLKVVKDICLGIGDGWSIGNLAPSEVYKAARSAHCDAAQAVFISGTNWRSIDVLESLEQDLGKPVISANQVSLWAALRYLKVDGVEGFGSLFQHH